jgi:secreted PhoX family phosphatase
MSVSQPSMSSRRRFLRGVGVAAAAAACPLGIQLAGAVAGATVAGYGELVSDPNGVLHLPADFAYRVISRTGDPMDDGLRVPGLPDGMHAFPGPEGRTVVLRNHELLPWSTQSAFRGRRDRPAPGQRALLYDPGRGALVGRGGVTSLIYDTRAGRLERQLLTLGGTLRNCAGGATPWGSWISCEETVMKAGEHGTGRDHGFNFEVSSMARTLVRAVPLVAMGRFRHEAVAVDPDSGIAYQTEDRMDGLLYRFIPEVRGRFGRSGRLEALSLRDLPGAFTGNHRARTVPVGEPLAVQWVPLANVSAPDDDLRFQGRSLGAAAFARGEGMTPERDTRSGTTAIWFACTAGGANRRGQLWRYRPSRAEGAAGDDSQPGELTLFLEPDDSALLDQGDNITLAPDGDLLVCEDNPRRQRLMGVTPAGGVYRLAENPRGDSELAGAAFAPDGSTLFLNLQERGLTLAVTGPWGRRRAS